MKKNNKLDITFGPMAFAGKILFFAALLPFFSVLFFFINAINFIVNNGFNATNYFDLIILPLLVLLIAAVIFFALAFLAFTTTYTKIDYANKRIKYGTKLSGIIPLGKWTYLTPDMKLGLKTTTEYWGAYSRGGTSTTLDYTDLKIYLYDADCEEIIPVKKVKKEKFAEEELEKLSKLLELSII